jgi:hypothetical protein
MKVSLQSTSGLPQELCWVNQFLNLSSLSLALRSLRLERFFI